MKTHRSGRDGASGEMAERSKAAVSKIAVRATVPRVRIPLSPPFFAFLPQNTSEILLNRINPVCQIV